MEQQSWYLSPCRISTMKTQNDKDEVTTEMRVATEDSDGEEDGEQGF